MKSKWNTALELISHLHSVLPDSGNHQENHSKGHAEGNETYEKV